MPEINAKEFNRAMGGVIRVEMQHGKLSFEAMGAKIGVSYQQIGKYVSGQNGLSAFRLVQIADALGVRHEALVSRALTAIAQQKLTKEQAA